jgi:hypothetical protein
LAVNPRAFPPPASTKSWAARAVLGERIYLARRGECAAPSRGRRECPGQRGRGRNARHARGTVYAKSALYPAGAGAAFLTKMRGIDRMVWLVDDMSRGSRGHARYAAWLR